MSVHQQTANAQCGAAQQVSQTAQSAQGYGYSYPQPNGACPHCGYCPHCGRSAQPYPYYGNPFIGQPMCGGTLQDSLGQAMGGSLGQAMGIGGLNNG